MSIKVDCAKLKALYKTATGEAKKAIAAMAPELFQRPDFPKLMRSKLDPDKLVYFTSAKNGTVVHRKAGDLRKIGKTSHKFAMCKFVDYDA